MVNKIKTFFMYCFFGLFFVTSIVAMEDRDTVFCQNVRPETSCFAPVANFDNNKERYEKINQILEFLPKTAWGPNCYKQENIKHHLLSLHPTLPTESVNKNIRGMPPALRNFSLPLAINFFFNSHKNSEKVRNLFLLMAHFGGNDGLRHQIYPTIRRQFMDFFRQCDDKKIEDLMKNPLHITCIGSVSFEYTKYGLEEALTSAWKAICRERNLKLDPAKSPVRIHQIVCSPLDYDPQTTTISLDRTSYQELVLWFQGRLPTRHVEIERVNDFIPKVDSSEYKFANNFSDFFKEYGYQNVYDEMLKRGNFFDNHLNQGGKIEGQCVTRSTDGMRDGMFSPKEAAKQEKPKIYMCVDIHDSFVRMLNNLGISFRPKNDIYTPVSSLKEIQKAAHPFKALVLGDLAVSGFNPQKENYQQYSNRLKEESDKLAKIFAQATLGLIPVFKITEKDRESFLGCRFKVGADQESPTTYAMMTDGPSEISYDPKDKKYIMTIDNYAYYR